jgi:hypothetical protein
MTNRQISRRTVLRGFGTALALPMLEAMRPLVAHGESGAKKIPTRVAFLYVPNGAHMPHWTPASAGGEFELPPILRPLTAFKDELLVLSGLAQRQAESLGDGPDDHARGLAAFLTGVHPRKTDGADIRAGVSVDQIAAAQIGQQTRLASLELGIDRGAQAGSCDSGYSCAYSSNISWKSESTPMPKEVDPRAVFDRLFGIGEPDAVAANHAKREQLKKSILDFVQEDARSLCSRLGTADRRKIDEYLNSVREIEQRIGRFGPVDPPPHARRPDHAPQDNAEHIRLMFDLLALAFETDTTRVATFMFANAGSNKSYPAIGISEGHHDLSHHSGNPQKHAKLARINTYHVEQLAYLLEKLRSLPEGNATLLDHSMILYGSGISDGNWHNHDNLPILLAGRGGGTIQTGRHVRCAPHTPLNNLFLAMLDRVGAPVDRLGDSTGRLSGLDT